MLKSKLPVDTGSPTRSLPMSSLSGKAFPPEAQSHHRWPTVAVCLFLAAMVWAVFGQTRHHGFINYDDAVYVYKNPTVTQGLSWRGILWALTHDNGLGGWFPLTDISHMLDWQLYGPNAGGHHLTNVLLHTTTAILLFLVLRKMMGLRSEASPTQAGAFWPAAFVAAVFAIHPLRVESVAWVVERKDVLSGLFFMLTLLCYVKAVAGDKCQVTRTDSIWSHVTCHRSRFYWLALVFFALGLLAKTMLVTLPFVLLLLDYWPLGRVTRLRSASARQAGGTWQVTSEKKPAEQLPTFGFLILEKVPFLLLSVAAGAATVLTQKNAVLVAQSLTFPWRVGNALLAYTDYLGHMFYPVGLALVYPHPGPILPAWKVGLSALLFLVISAGVMAGRRKYPYLLAGWLWYLIMLLPVIDIMQAGQNARADRYTYLPQIGLYILMTWGAVELFNSWRYRRVVLGLAAGAILAGLLAAAYIQTGYWQDSVSLWTHTLACTSDNSTAHNYLGTALIARKKWPEAVQHFERALQLNPDYAEAHLNLGAALVSQGKRDEAIQHFERALQLNPRSVDALYNLGDALATAGKLAEAIQYFERALQLKPDYTEAHYGLGLALASQGEWVDATRHFELALHLKLDHADAQYISGVALATQSKWDEAIALYERVLQLKPDFAEARYKLGIALASQGKSAEATQQFQEALTLATAQGNTALAESIRTRLNTNPPALPQPQTP
jgi:tetratricopeptide (TPR) repeat protein